MRIEELILDGFKSYPVRTTISGFDESFNAITGLNGSGKSNILDAICFVLGITNMQSVRANNLMDLIYKRGQAGVTRASVTIVFNNTDRSKSPVAYMDHPQVTVTRQIATGNVSKYLINGRKSTLLEIQTMFQSIQLNINNPNFLIMQGKITKVLNMKPAETLGMVEEAAGTRMFEERKDKAVKTMAKKDKKVEEIETLLREEIDPKLEKLRAEKRSYLEYQKVTTDLDRLTRLTKAYEYQTLVGRLEKAERELQRKEEEAAARRAGCEAAGRELGELEGEVKRVKAAREKEMAKGGKMQALTDAVNSLEREIVKTKTQVEIKEGGVADEVKRSEEAKKGVKKAQKDVDSRRSATESDSASFAALKASYDTAQAALEKQEELLQTLLTGLSSASASGSDASGSAGGYMGQVAEAKAAASAAGTEAEQAKVRVQALEREVKEKEPRAKKAEKEGEGARRELEAKRREVEGLRSRVQGAQWTEEREREAEGRLAEGEEKLRDLVEQRDALRSRLAGTDFTYSSPSPNFDRSKVHGLVANLVDLDESIFASAQALEVCAGGRLYNVVVADEVTGSQLLEKGRLKQRVTIIPLNKINAFKLSAEKIANAQRLAPGKVNLALSLVGYPAEVSAAMSYVFGSTLICADKATAKAVTFDRSVGAKSVTLEGDVYDPSGTLSGGAAPKGQSVLVRVQELKRVEGAVGEVSGEVERLRRELGEGKAEREKARRERRELQVMEHEVGLLQEQVGGSNAAKIVAEVEAARAALAELKGTIEQAKERQKAAQAEVKRLEKEMADFNKNKDSKLNEIKADIATKKKELVKLSAQVKSRQKEVQTAEIEFQQLQQDLQGAEQEVVEAEAAVKKAQKELAVLNETLETQQADHARAEAKLQAELATLNAFTAELAALEQAIQGKKAEISEHELGLKRLEHELGTHGGQRAGWEGAKGGLEKQFGWILEERQFFGKPGTPYDFTNFNFNQEKEKHRELEQQHKGMGKKVNTKVMNMIEGVEKKEQALKKMMATVLKDKGMIEDTIVELDRYKRDALMKTWEKVNEMFGPTFADLLPGNFAKLQPPEGQDVTEGLEVKVRLGSVWKESLTELSGGQRSLIALSLIMSLLQFKPAPMYILDEIDAALDLQHTQHIGQLFRNRFHGSQFIVVSLKEGLFANANVLFKARFRDGTSVVERTARRSTNSLYTGADGKENEPEGAGGKRAGAASRAPLTVK